MQVWTWNATEHGQVLICLQCFWPYHYSTKKTEVMFQPAPIKDYIEPTITVNWEALKVVDNFTYLGSTLSRDVHIDDEGIQRIAKASAAFGNLRDKVWEREGLSTQAKLEVYKAAILPSLLYSCETWTVYSRHVKSLNSFPLSVCGRYWKFVGKTKSQTLKYSVVLTWQA